MRRIIFGGLLLVFALGVGLRTAERRTQESYIIQRGMGVISHGNDMAVAPHPWWHLTNVMPNHAMLDDIAEHGIKIAWVWVRVNPFDGAGTWCWRPFYPYSGYGDEVCTPSDRIADEDMDLFWTHPDIKTIIVRFEAWAELEEKCNGAKGLVIEHEPTRSIVETLYEKYWDQDKTIIIQNWEGDWQMYGATCRERDQCAAMDDWGFVGDPEWTQEEYCDNFKLSRREYLLRIFNERQKAIEETRRLHPNVPLRVFHSVCVNFYTDEWLTVARDVIPMMDRKPDFIGISYWKRLPITVTDALNYVKGYTGLSNRRIFITELGEKETNDGDQYERIMREATAAFRWGVQMVVVWHWKYWGNNEQQKELSMFEEDNETPRSGYWAIRELNRKWGRR